MINNVWPITSRMERLVCVREIDDVIRQVA
jgi:hypothetical protein